jgi:hypothetical protein
MPGGPTPMVFEHPFIHVRRIRGISKERPGITKYLLIANIAWADTKWMIVSYTGMGEYLLELVGVKHPKGALIEQAIGVVPKRM